MSNVNGPAEVDVVVIGAGHNGLVAANYLADAGLDVVVVEAADQIGGMTASGTPIPGAPDHVVNYCAVDLVFWSVGPVGRELALDRHGLRTIPVDPPYAYLHPDGASVAIWKDPRRTADEIRRFSRQDAESYLEYARFIDAFADLAFPFMMTNPLRPDPRAVGKMAKGVFRHRRELLKFGSFALASAEEILDNYFTHPVTRGAIHTIVSGGWPVDGPGTAAIGLVLGFVMKGTVLRPVGGMGAVPAALRNRLGALGGSVLTGARVAEITIAGGRATGVMLADGRQLGARRAVVASCDPRTLYERLVPAGTLPPRLENRARHIPANARGNAAMKVDMAFSGRLDLRRHHRWRGDGVNLKEPGLLIGTPETTNRGFARSIAGEVCSPEEMAMWTAVPTAVDPSQAPEGMDTLYLYAPTVPLDPTGGWKERQDEAADAMVSRAAQFFDGVDTLELGRWVESPLTMAERTGATNGCVMHVDWDLSRAGPLRPAPGLGGYQTPIPGLYLGGSGTHPGGAVTGLPGRLAAREVLRNLKRAKTSPARP